MVTGCPFLLQVTEVAGEPKVVQVMAKDEVEVCCKVNPAMLG